MWKKVLIANRGEIAVRIIRACREAGLQCVTVYSTADKTALHAEIADESVCIGPPSVQDSYLNMNALISACQNTGAEALHPGFGFLSESAEFAQLCIDNGITFIGPSPASISMLGDKARAKETMKAAGVPVIPGSDGAVTSVAIRRHSPDLYSVKKPSVPMDCWESIRPRAASLPLRLCR